MQYPSTQISSPLINGLSAPARATREAVARLGQELSSGRTADAAESLRHDFSALGIAERDLSLAEGLRLSIAHGQRISNAAETALAGIATELDGVSSSLLPMINGGNAFDPQALASSGWSAFERIVDLMNARQDGTAIFGGGRGDVDPVGNVDDIRADLTVLAAAATDPADLNTRIRTYFGAGGDFETNRIAPGAPDDFAFRTSAESKVSFAPRTNDPEFRAALEAAAQIASLAESGFVTDQNARDYLAIDATAVLAQAGGGIIGLRADVGNVGAALDRAEDALSERIGRAQTARDDLIGIDPFETASRLEEEAARLETIYTLTARLSRLRLTNYL